MGCGASSVANGNSWQASSPDGEQHDKFPDAATSSRASKNGVASFGPGGSARSVPLSSGGTAISNVTSVSAAHNSNAQLTSVGTHGTGAGLKTVGKSGAGVHLHTSGSHIGLGGGGGPGALTPASTTGRSLTNRSLGPVPARDAWAREDEDEEFGRALAPFFWHNYGTTPSPGTTGPGSKQAAAPGGGGVVPRFEQEWDVVKFVGKGQFGTVHHVVHKGTGQVAACKKLDKGKTKRSVFEAEVEAMRLSRGHPGVVNIFGVYESTNSAYLLMELVEGGELFDRLVEAGAYSEKEAREPIRCAVAAVAHLHSLGIVHRDLKPENLLLVSKDRHDGRLKVADFGLSKVLPPGAPKLTPICGTWAYSAPEMRAAPDAATGKRHGYDQGVDVWALGVIAYIVLCGFHPFDPSGEAGQTDILEAIQAGRYDFLEPAWASISDQAKDLVRGMLTVDPGKRFTAAQALSHPWMRNAYLSAQPLSPNIGHALDGYRRRMAAKMKATALVAIASVHMMGGQEGAGKGRRWSAPSVPLANAIPTAADFPLQSLAPRNGQQHHAGGVPLSSRRPQQGAPLALAVRHIPEGSPAGPAAGAQAHPDARVPGHPLSAPGLLPLPPLGPEEPASSTTGGGGGLGTAAEGPGAGAGVGRRELLGLPGASSVGDSPRSSSVGSPLAPLPGAPPPPASTLPGAAPPPPAHSLSLSLPRPALPAHRVSQGLGSRLGKHGSAGSAGPAALPSLTRPSSFMLGQGGGGGMGGGHGHGHGGPGTPGGDLPSLAEAGAWLGSHMVVTSEVPLGASTGGAGGGGRGSKGGGGAGEVASAVSGPVHLTNAELAHALRERAREQQHQQQLHHTTPMLSPERQGSVASHFDTPGGAGAGTPKAQAQAQALAGGAGGGVAGAGRRHSMAVPGSSSAATALALLAATGRAGSSNQGGGGGCANTPLLGGAAHGGPGAPSPGGGGLQASVALAAAHTRVQQAPSLLTTRPVVCLAGGEGSSASQAAIGGGAAGGGSGVQAGSSFLSLLGGPGAGTGGSTLLSATAIGLKLQEYEEGHGLGGTGGSVELSIALPRPSATPSATGSALYRAQHLPAGSPLLGQGVEGSAFYRETHLPAGEPISH